jgi:hypothetical protein
VTVRGYLPTTLRMLGEYVATGQITGAHDLVVATEESEDAEYAALCEAADLSAALVGREGPRGRRVVVVVETADPRGTIPLHEVVAVQADTTDVDPYDEDPAELAWFATQEIADLLI